jgi:hypothetical protein
MAAGLGFKTFNTGDILSASDVNGYLMQGVLVFADATARNAAITSPQEGQFAYLKDTNVTTYYTGSAWANLDTTGMTNPMTTTGDTIYSSSGSTPARLGIGTTGQVLTVAGGVPSWATPSAGGGGKVLQVVYATYGTQVNSTSSTYADTNLTATITPTLNTSKVLVIVHQNGCEKRQTDTSMMLKLLRDSTNISQMASLGGYTGSTADLNFGSISTAVLDAPATTSATTYKTQFASNSNSSRVSVQHGDGGAGGSVSTITLMEIGA